ncbi:MAG: hypothetical protein HYR95_01130, partial [Candidatus Colwellbacteria bacterium]|nr:hypothetical protein [Candidatus Colwellbacteria bacterium]
MSLLKRIFHLKEREVSRTEPGFEEMERKTPKTGIILLIIMFALGLSFGWVAVDDLARVPAMPPELSSCSNRYLSEGSSYDSTPIYSRLEESYPDSRKYFYDDSRNCQFNDLENQNGIPALISKRLPLEDQLRVVSEKYNNTQNTLQETRRQVQDLRSKYGIGLEEKQANIPNKIFPVTPDIQNQILKLGETEKGLEQDVAR